MHAHNRVLRRVSVTPSESPPGGRSGHPSMADEDCLPKQIFPVSRSLGCGSAAPHLRFHPETRRRASPQAPRRARRPGRHGAPQASRASAAQAAPRGRQSGRSSSRLLAVRAFRSVAVTTLGPTRASCQPVGVTPEGSPRPAPQPTVGRRDSTATTGAGSKAGRSSRPLRNCRSSDTVVGHLRVLDLVAPALAKSSVGNMHLGSWLRRRVLAGSVRFLGLHRRLPDDRRHPRRVLLPPRQEHALVLTRASLSHRLHRVPRDQAAKTQVE